MTDSSKAKPSKGFEFPPEFAQCISQVIACWSTLEYNIDMSIWHLAGVYPAVGACITSQIFTLDGRLKALLALLKLRKASDALVSRVNKFSERVRKPLEIRNRITHDTWGQNPETKKMAQLNIGAKGILTYGFKPIAIEVLQEDLQTVRTAMKESADIREAIENALPTLPEIHLRELQPTVFRSQDQKQTRASDGTFLLFPPKPFET